VSFPMWFLQAIQGRLEEVSAQIEYDSKLGRIREEESEAFQALFASVDVGRMPEFVDWEDKHHFRQAIQNERLYLQGLKDGVQLAAALLSSSASAEKEMPC
jgi:hypothetical protein